MKIIMIGAVAAGTSAAAKARRNSEEAEIVIYEKDQFISYSACGMPYLLGEEGLSLEDLTPRDPAFFEKRYQIQVKTGYEVLEIHSDKQEIQVKNRETGELFTDSYDKLVIATGATAFVPDLPGVQEKQVFSLRTMRDMTKIQSFLQENTVKQAVIVGTGFIGMELAENLLKQDISVTMLEQGPKITGNLDGDMGTMLEEILIKKSIKLEKNCQITAISATEVKTSTGEQYLADLVIFATGVRPNSHLAQKAGVLLGASGAIQVNDKMETNIPHIYSCGDCIETFSAITGKPVYRPLGSTANKTGRIAGDVVTGGNLRYQGHLSTGIFRFFEYTVASTGLTEAEALENGFSVEVCHNIKPNRATYLAGEEMHIKGIADRETGRLLGVQIIGKAGVDKRIDVFATLITYKAKVEELFHLDLAYAPPFSTTKDPVHYTGMILDNAIDHNRPLIRKEKLAEMIKTGEKVQIIDCRSSADIEKKGSIKTSLHIPQAKLRDENLPLDKEVLTVTFCNKGVTGNAAQNILINRGFRQVKNLSGGHQFYKIKGKSSGEKP